MKQGDFTTLAKAYKYRPGYSMRILDTLFREIQWSLKKSGMELDVADVGAGTGKLTENLLELGVKVTSVEPNEAMREEGKKYLQDNKNVVWKEGLGEETNLKNASIDWLLMGSCFHWVDFEQGTEEINRVLKPGGFFTAIWNPRNIAVSELHSRIERKIADIVPELDRKSSGTSAFTADLMQKLIKTGFFQDVFFLETEYFLEVSKERYMGAWHSTNDIQAQAGPERWQKIISMIENEIENLPLVMVPYKTRAWTGVKRF